jgi:eukaryotic-like serine/threonine-protein kinase
MLTRMTGERVGTAPRVPFVGAGLDTHAGVGFVQARLALLGKTVFLLAFTFYLVINGVIFSSGLVPLFGLLAQHHNVWHLLAASIMAVVWALASVRPWPLWVVGVIDAAALPLAGIALSIMAAQPDPDQLYAAVLAVTVTVMARAVLIPSTAVRTFCLSWLAGVPIIIVSYVFHEPPGPVGPFAPGLLRIANTVGTSLWMILATTLATVASRTIYGLRKQVEEAAEIGQYTLEAKIGSGGMGEVWRARHRMLIRPAAVKLIRPQGLGSSPGRDHDVLLRRFEREARATAGLRSPHTVQLYDFGVTDDGTLYYVMELLEGMDLETLVEQFGPMPAERAIYLLTQVCASLEDAHENGLVHRDIKPANVVVGRFGTAWDFVKVLDFGLVKLDSSAHDENLRLTTEGAASGTPAYMAPEVALAEANTTHAVDIYALGCVAYWLVTGKLVFEGPGAMKVMMAHAHTPPPAPSTRVELPIPPELEALILQCLEKNPAKRPASAAALQARLQAIPVAKAWTRERAEQWWSLHAPTVAARRPVAEVLLSHEARPPRVIRQARN